MRAGVTDGQPAAELVKYVRPPYFVTEYLVRDESNRIIGKIVCKQLMSDARVPPELDYVTVSTVDDRPEAYEPLTPVFIAPTPTLSVTDEKQRRWFDKWINQKRKEGEEGNN